MQEQIELEQKEPATRIKTPGSGRKKGTPNKITLLKETLSQSEDHQEQYKQTMQKLYEAVVLHGSTSAAKLWIDEYHNKLTHKLVVQTRSFEEIEEAAESIVKMVFEGGIPLSVGQKVLNILGERKKMREGVIEAAFEEILREESKKLRAEKRESR